MLWLVVFAQQLVVTQLMCLKTSWGLTDLFIHVNPLPSTRASLNLCIQHINKLSMIREIHLIKEETL